MAWIESHTSLEKHHKVIRLRLAMRWSKNETIGFLHRFWWTVLEVSPSGDITALSSPEVMAEMLDMPVEAVAKALNVMMDPDPKFSFLDRKGGLLLVHDWLDYAGRYLSESKFKRSPGKMGEIRNVHGQPLDIPGIVPDTRPTNQTNQPDRENACVRVDGFRPEVRSEEAVALASQRRNSGVMTQAVHDRALRITALYPSKAKKDSRPIDKSLHAQNLLASLIAANPDYPWEEHAQLVHSIPMPKDLLKWAEDMPNPVALESLRAAGAKTSTGLGTSVPDFYNNFKPEDE